MKVWVLHTGGNNIRKGRPLKEREMSMYGIIVRVLLLLGAEGCKVICTGQLLRKDVDDSTVEESNKQIEARVKEVDAEYRGGRVVYLPVPEGIPGKEKERLVDHVHLDELGYRIWAGAVNEEVERLLAS